MKRLLLLLAMSLYTQTAAQTPQPRLPAQVQPGQVQPIAPGTQAAPTLLRLALNPAIPEVRKVEVLSNGFISVAHALILVPAKKLTPAYVDKLAQQAVLGSYQAQPGLSEVDVSVYRAETYQGFGGPLPVLTLSVPRSRLAAFPTELQKDTFDRVWVNPNLEAKEVDVRPIQQRERRPVFVGTPAEQRRQQLQQSQALVRGGVRGGLIFRGDVKNKEVALTFDDVPHPLYFPLVLDALRREKAKATFFIIGRNAQAYPYFIRDLVKDGHELGNHTFHHVRLPKLSDAQITQELKTTSDLLTKLTGKPARYFRPPGGEYSGRVLKIAAGLGLTNVFWTNDPGDFQNPGVETVESRFARHLRPGGIILLHDNAPDGLVALPDLLKVAREKGYAVDTVGNFAQ